MRRVARGREGRPCHAVAARPRSLCRLVAAGCFLVAVLALSGVGAAFLSYHVLGPRVVRAYNIIVHDEL